MSQSKACRPPTLPLKLCAGSLSGCLSLHIRQLRMLCCACIVPEVMPWEHRIGSLGAKPQQRKRGVATKPPN